MAIYNAAGVVIQSNVTNAISNALTNVVTNQLPDNIPKSSDNYVDYASNQILTQAGIQLGNIGFANSSQINLVNNAQEAAQTIASNVSDGSLNDRNYQSFLNYDENDARQFYSSTDGGISRSINALFDTVTSLSVDKQTDRRLFNPGYAIESDSVSSPPKVPEVIERLGTLSSPKAWTDDLIPYQPKFKYLYIVEFNFYPEYQSDIPTDFTFLAHKFEKPKISVNYEEVNFYNFRTHVPTKSTFGNISLEIHDDIKSASMNFLVAYLRRVSPLFNQESTKYRDYFETSGMSFDDATSSYNLYTVDNNVNIIESIKVYHIYNANKTMDLHIFNNPKLTEANLHDFDMSSGESGCSIGLEFAIDNYSISAGVTPQIPEHKLAINELGTVESEFLAVLGSINDLKYTKTNRASSDMSDKTNADPLTGDDTKPIDYLMGSTTDNPSDYQSLINSIKNDVLNGTSDTGKTVSDAVSNYDNTEDVVALKTSLVQNISPTFESNKLTTEQAATLEGDPNTSSVPNKYEERADRNRARMDRLMEIQDMTPIMESINWNTKSVSDDKLNTLNNPGAATPAQTEEANTEIKERVSSMFDNWA
jgi:hypothetical protein